MAKKTTAKKTVVKKSKSSIKKPTPSGLAMGVALPNIQLASTAGRDFLLQDFKGKVVVLYFYPKDATPGCTVESHDFSNLKKEFQKVGAEVFGVSRDSLSSHERFKEKQKYTVDLLSDSDEKACGIFGVMKIKNMYGRKVMGVERSTFVIDRAGKLIKEWRGVKVAGHAEAVLEFVRSLQS